jgi:hypothetical protein
MVANALRSLTEVYGLPRTGLLQGVIGRIKDGMYRFRIA